MEDSHRCHTPVCDWIHDEDLTRAVHIPPLLANPELSGIGVILGFSITAYLTLVLLVLHYITVYDYRRRNLKGKYYVNPVDRGTLIFLRERILPWKPSRRFEYAMEKAVIILSDTQLATGLAFLIAGYTQITCGISAYHWQMMVYVAWFSSFSFLSAMAFLESYLQTNNSLRLLRVFFMFTLGSFMIVALLPTGSHNWLQLMDNEGGFYPSLPAICFYEQMREGTYRYRGGPKIWSMIVSLLVVIASYVHTGVRLFDPTAEFTRKYLRTWPGKYVKRVMYLLEQRAANRGLRAALWRLAYMIIFAGFASIRAFYDLVESMLLEILWLGFAIAWGTVKLWVTRGTLTLRDPPAGQDHLQPTSILDEDYWSFGQTLPLALLLIPLLAMAQTYFDNDAKAAEAAHQAQKEQLKALEILSRPHQGDAKARREAIITAQELMYASYHSGVGTVDGARESASLDPQTLDAIRRLLQDTSRSPARDTPQPPFVPPVNVDLGRPPLPDSKHRYSLPPLPQHPYVRFTQYTWYCDHIFLLLCQAAMLSAFILYCLTNFGDFLGLSALMRSRLFLAWILGIAPLACFSHLFFWYLAAWLAHVFGLSSFLFPPPSSSSNIPFPETIGTIEEDSARSSVRFLKRWKRVRGGEVVCWGLRMGLVGGLLMFTLFVSSEVAGPDPLYPYVKR